MLTLVKQNTATVALPLDDCANVPTTGVPEMTAVASVVLKSQTSSEPMAPIVAKSAGSKTDPFVTAPTFETVRMSASTAASLSSAQLAFVIRWCIIILPLLSPKIYRCSPSSRI